MAVCEDCQEEMQTADTCVVGELTIDGRPYERIAFGAERPRWSQDRCGDCRVLVGGFHHLGCDIEQCPRCRRQLISCGCRDEPDERYADVSSAITISAKLTAEQPDADLIDIVPVAACGHVGRSHIRDLDRTSTLPVEEWCDLGRGRGESAAILFVCRSADYEHVDENDLDIARAISDHLDSPPTLGWDLVFLTGNGNFRASEMLGLAGLPDFGPCPCSLLDA